MKKYFVFSDIHGFYDLWMETLEDNGFDINNPEHVIIVCGDLLDRGNGAVKCLEFVNNLPSDRKVLIKGNHEDLMQEIIQRGYFQSHDKHNRTDDTIFQLTGVVNDGSWQTAEETIKLMKTNELWNTYINNCVDYFELDDYIFVHGWIPVTYKTSEDEKYSELPMLYRPSYRCYNPDWRDTVWVDDWKEARWLNGMMMWKTGIVEPNKTIVCGHFHTSWGHAYLHDDGEEFLDEYETYYIDPDTGMQEPHANFDIFYDDGIIAIDACTALTNKINCLVIEL